MSTHKAIVTTAPRAPLSLLNVSTPSLQGNEVLIRVEWTASTPLDMHQAESGLLVNHPQVLGDSVAGTVVGVGEAVEGVGVGDGVFTFTLHAHQEYILVPSTSVGRIPPNISMQEAATLPDNFVTVFHTLTHDLHLSLPWPKPASYAPADSQTGFLIWGGASSVGMYALQILRFYGYTNVIAVASPGHHKLLGGYGARKCFDYNAADVEDALREEIGVRYVFDTIGHLDGSVRPISRVVGMGTQVAVLLPVIVVDAREEGGPVYEMDVEGCCEWAEGVGVRGVRTYFWAENAFFKEKLQAEIMPALLTSGDVKPNPYRAIEGATMVERAQKALDVLKGKGARGERLVWKVWEGEYDS
ncbi:GroES-like protein [Glarea lozoyensis ATCC 20868]|uniref:GroES-like protein n=1 Tax=Glarea lozoyensis (strain ATCC 20868 / MF5171) TaxID=1116229 RepID=S3D0E9_GLAL2|nr:GroES-like protein [Glarea lozoyensis ATCC 20868]EPE31310.1 GroES-like protein [Glarea lozoyensis ATCC 20868]